MPVRKVFATLVISQLESSVRFLRVAPTNTLSSTNVAPESISFVELAAPSWVPLVIWGGLFLLGLLLRKRDESISIGFKNEV